MRRAPSTLRSRQGANGRFTAHGRCRPGSRRGRRTPGPTHRRAIVAVRRGRSRHHPSAPDATPSDRNAVADRRFLSELRENHLVCDAVCPVETGRKHSRRVGTDTDATRLTVVLCLRTRPRLVPRRCRRQSRRPKPATGTSRRVDDDFRTCEVPDFELLSVAVRRRQPRQSKSPLRDR